MLKGYWNKSHEVIQSGEQVYCKTNNYYFAIDDISWPDKIIHRKDDKFFILVYGDIFSINQEAISTENAIQKIISEAKNIDNILKQINGDFLLFLIDIEKEIFTAARDKMGLIPYYYDTNDKNLSFSTNLAFLVKNKIKLNEQWLIDCITTTFSQTDFTAYKNIKRLPAANSLTLLNEHLQIKKYWEYSSEFSKDVQKEYIIELEQRLIKSIKTRFNNNLNVATELSGGLDSSVVSAIVANISKEKNYNCFAISHILDNDLKDKVYPYNDEIYYSKSFIESYPYINHILFSKNKLGFLDSLREIVRSLKYPMQQNYIQFQIDSLNFAEKEGIKQIFTGFGGDNALSSSGVNIAKEKFASFNFRFIFKHKTKLQKKYNSNSIIVIFLKLIHEVFGNILISRIKRFFVKDYNFLLLDKKYLKLARHKPFNNQSNYNNHIIKTVVHSYVFQRIETMMEYGYYYGVEFKFPLLDSELIQYYLSIPSDLKTNTTETRYLFRQVAKKYLPELIYKRYDKSGTTIPYLHAEYLKDYEKVKDFICFCRDNLKEHYVNYDEMLKWHKVLKNKNSDTPSKYKMALFVRTLNVLIFQDLYERGEI